MNGCRQRCKHRHRQTKINRDRYTRTAAICVGLIIYGLEIWDENGIDGEGVTKGVKRGMVRECGRKKRVA